MKQIWLVGRSALVLAGVIFLTFLFTPGVNAQLIPGGGGSKLGGGGTNGMGPMTVTLPEVPQPGISAKLTNGTQILVTITNGVSYANYELYQRPSLDIGHSWRLSQKGGPGQTNFVFEMSYDYEFYQVCVGSDWDGDNVDNSSDADPLNASIGQLSVTISAPGNGSVVQ